MSEHYEWEGDWSSVTASEASWAEKELASELAPGHILAGQQFTALGRRWRRDDFLFQMSDGRFARVHLTRRVETDPRWPTVDFFDSFEAWKALPLEDR